MSRAQPPSGLLYFRLRGEVGGVGCSFTVRPGENLVGSRPENHIVLADRSVSRRHALLVSGAEGLVLEDLGSKNGTSVNGQRVDTRVLAPGDEVRLGGVILRLELVDAADARLAIATDTPAAGVPEGAVTTRATQTAPAALAPEGGHWLALLEEVLAEQEARPAVAAPTLAVLVRALQLEACCAVVWNGAGNPAVVAAVGEVGDVLRQPAVGELVRRLRASGGGPSAVSTVVVPGSTTAVCTVVAGAEREPFGLVATGARLGHEHVSLLRVVARLLAGQRSAPVATGDTAAPRDDTALVFPPGFVPGPSPAMAELFREMRPLSQGDLPVLITGETGVGKELVARTLYLSSPRRSGPFVAVNCAALPADLLEAELFGIGRGVATGVDQREGRFQQAEGGVLLLDEIADMSPPLQAKLLRALQEREVHPVGGRRPVAVNVRVIASTNAEPLRLVEEGRFRADLYYRIAGSVLRVPPLRERREDIGALVEHFVQRFAVETGKTVRGVTVRALTALQRYPWPGNVRELEHEVRRMVYLCPHGQAVDSTLLPRHAQGGATSADEEPLTLADRLAELEERLVREALRRANGNRTQAARQLGISRNGLAIKMERLGIEVAEET